MDDLLPVPPVQVPRLGAGHPELARMVAEAAAGGTPMMLLHIDIDYFSLVNENMGVEVGDEALQLLAERLESALAGKGMLWRHGSDEFVAAVPRNDGLPDPVAFGQLLRNEVELPLAVPPYTLFLNAKVGISLCPEHGADASVLLHTAEIAVRQSALDENERVLLYAHQSPGRAHSESVVARQIVEAISNDELRLRYQPKVSARDGRLIGLEALLRWHSRDLGMLAPERFMPTAERLGVIVQIGNWVLQHAIGQARQWRDMGHDDFFVAVNVSTLQLLRPGFVDEVLEMVRKAGLGPGSIVLELNESTLNTNVGAVNAAVRTLRSEGMGLSLDNFGTEESSLSALVRYPADMLKIDRSFISSSPAGDRETAIVRAIIAMGHQLDMKVIANGVETEAQLGFLRRSDCDVFQGYLFGEPMDTESAGAALRRRFLRPELFTEARSDHTLLLLDDEENVLRSLVRLFRRDGYRILVAGNVRDAFDLLATNDVQVILSDQRMSDMNGTEFLGRVKMLYPDTIRMVLSGYTDLATVTDAINRGAIYRFLTKPWNDDELREHIRQAFHAHDAQRKR